VSLRRRCRVTFGGLLILECSSNNTAAAAAAAATFCVSRNNRLHAHKYI